MADEGTVGGRITMNSDDWKKGLSDAQVAAGQFIAYMQGLESKLGGIASGATQVAGAIASIGGVSAAVEAELYKLASGGTTVAKLASELGMIGSELTTQVDFILKGNAEQVQSYEMIGKAYEKAAGEALNYAKALDTLKLEQKKLDYRKSYRDMNAGAEAHAAGGKPTYSAAELYESTNPMDYDDAEKLRIAQRRQRITRLAGKYGIKGFESKDLPQVEHGEGQQALNTARLSYAYSQLRIEIDKVKAAETALQKEANACFASMKRDVGNYVRVMKEAEVETKRLDAVQQKIKATEARRAMDSMYVRGPSAGRLAELKAAGVISAFGHVQSSTGKATTLADRFFTKFEKGTSLATKGTMSLVRGLQNANSTMAMMTSSFTGLMVMLTGATMGSFFKMSMDFEKSMARVGTLVKKGESDVKTLTQQVRELSRQFGATPMDMAEGFRIAISSDIAPGEAMQFVKEAAKLAVTSNASIEKTTDLLAMLKNAFNLTTADMSHLRDMIFVMTDRGRTEVEQFAAEIGKIAPTARLAGVNIQEMMAAFAALSRTRSTEQAGTLLRNLFKNIIEPSKDAKTELKKIELGLTPVQVKAQGLMETIRKFREELKKNPETLNAVAEDLRELAAWGELTDSQFEALVSTFIEMGNAVGLGDQKLQEMLDTTSVRWDRLMAQMRISAMDMIQGIVESFAGITKGVDKVELAQKKIEKAFKQVELAARYFMSSVEFVMAGILSVVAPVAGVLMAVYELYMNIFNLVQRGMANVNLRDLTKQAATIDGMILRTKEAGKRGTHSPEVIAKELARLYKMREEIGKETEKGLAGLNEVEVDIEGRINDAVNAVKAGWKLGITDNPIADMFVENAKKAGELAQEIADLDHVIKIMEEDARAAAAATGGVGKLGSSLKEARDKAAAVAEALRATTEQTVRLGKDALKQWVVDNRDTISGMITGYRKLATEQKSLVGHMRSELKDLIKDQRKFDDSIQDTINKIKDVDDKKKSPIDRLKERGKRMEERANEAAKEGDRNEVQRLLQEAMGYYEEILNVADTKGNRKVVVEALERLKKGMDDVYGKEKVSLQDRIVTAEEAAQKFTNSANVVEASFKQLEQGIREVTREIENMGKTPSIETLNKLKAKIAELMSGTDFFLTAQTDPILATMDKMIEKAKELGVEMKAAFNVPAYGQDVNVLAKQPGYMPLTDMANPINTSIRNRITNVDAVHVNVGGLAGSEGAKQVDARRLAREIKRHIERGEAPGLGARQQLDQYRWDAGDSEQYKWRKNR